MEALRERTDINLSATELEAQRHNAQIAERYRRLQNAELDQFAPDVYAQANAVAEPVRTVFAPETPVSETPVMQQTPQVTEFVHERVTNSVFTTEKFDAMAQNAYASYEMAAAATVAQPTYIAPVMEQASVAAKTEAVAQYSLSTFAKVVMAVFAAVVIAMLTLICVNSAVINQKTVQLQALQTQRAQLVQEYEELRQEIQEEISEETIRQFALENGMTLAD